LSRPDFAGIRNLGIGSDQGIQADSESLSDQEHCVSRLDYIGKSVWRTGEIRLLYRLLLVTILTICWIKYNIGTVSVLVFQLASPFAHG
jgi:hypothetical protein